MDVSSGAAVDSILVAVSSSGRAGVRVSGSRRSRCPGFGCSRSPSSGAGTSDPAAWVPAAVLGTAVGSAVSEGCERRCCDGASRRSGSYGCYLAGGAGRR